MGFSGDCNQMCTHRSTTIPLSSHNPINEENENKKGRNVRDRRKRGREWKNRKERDAFGNGWGCCLLAKIISRYL